MGVLVMAGGSPPTLNGGGPRRHQSTRSGPTEKYTTRKIKHTKLKRKSILWFGLKRNALSFQAPCPNCQPLGFWIFAPSSETRHLRARAGFPLHSPGFLRHMLRFAVLPSGMSVLLNAEVGGAHALGELPLELIELTGLPSQGRWLRLSLPLPPLVVAGGRW